MNIHLHPYAPPQPRPPSSPEDGILLIDKPAGVSSHDVVPDIRHHVHFAKVGHGGTLDPGATALMLILLGKGTSLSNQIMGCDKTYIGEILLGTETTTQDLEGEVVATLPFVLVGEERLRKAMEEFTGDVYQTPPMVSAVKVKGVPLYKLARRGEDVKREPRLIHVYRFSLLGYDAETGVGRFEVKCGKGTYIRTLCHDVGKALGCGACMKSLRRTQCGSFTLDQSIPHDDAMKLDRAALVDRIIPMARYLQG